MKSLLRFRSEGSHRGCPIEQLREIVHIDRSCGRRPKKNNMIQGVTAIHTSILQINVSQDVVKDMYQSTEHTVRYPTKEKTY
jgi:chemotaxis signal transduction protein